MGPCGGAEVGRRPSRAADSHPEGRGARTGGRLVGRLWPAAPTACRKTLEEPHRPEGESPVPHFRKATLRTSLPPGLRQTFPRMPQPVGYQRKINKLTSSKIVNCSLKQVYRTQQVKDWYLQCKDSSVNKRTTFKDTQEILTPLKEAHGQQVSVQHTLGCCPSEHGDTPARTREHRGPAASRAGEAGHPGLWRRWAVESSSDRNRVGLVLMKINLHLANNLAVPLVGFSREKCPQKT